VTKRFILASALLVFWAVMLCAGAGCKWIEAADRIIPDIEACLTLPNGGRVCAIKENGKWRLLGDLTPEEEREAIGMLERSN